MARVAIPIRVLQLTLRVATNSKLSKGHHLSPVERATLKSQKGSGLGDFALKNVHKRTRDTRKLYVLWKLVKPGSPFPTTTRATSVDQARPSSTNTNQPSISEIAQYLDALDNETRSNTVAAREAGLSIKQVLSDNTATESPSANQAKQHKRQTAGSSDQQEAPKMLKIGSGVDEESESGDE
jgi:hypothetical protein